MIQHPKCPECNQEMHYQSQVSPDGRMRQWWVCETTSHHPSCPACDSSMLLRLALQGPNVGKHFWGCENFPQCRATRDYPYEDATIEITRQLSAIMDEPENWKPPRGRKSAVDIMVDAAQEAIKEGCEHLVFDTIAHPEGSGVKHKRHCECCHQSTFFEKYDEVSEDAGIPLKHEWRTWHVICDRCMSQAHGRYKTRLRQMPVEYRQFVYESMPQIRRQGLRQLDDSRPPEKPACFGGLKSMYVDEHKSHDCMLCIHEHKCHAEAFEFWRTEVHPDECHCEQCESDRKTIVDQIIDLSNEIKRKERETGKVPNCIPASHVYTPFIPIVKNKGKLPSLDEIVAVQPMTARSENIFMEKNADGTQTMCFKPSTPYNWRYVLRPVVKLERRRSSGWDPESSGASRRDGWDS